VPVYAHDGTDDGSSDSTSTTTESDDTAATDTETHSGTNDRQELRHKAAELVQELHKEHKAKSAEQRTKVCEAHKHGLETKFSRITTNSQRLEDRIGTFLTKAQDYQSSQNVTVTNWDTLVASANTAKTSVDAAITNLKAVTPSLDCNSATVAQDVATFKEAATSVRDALKAYKTAVKNVFVALENAKDTTNTSTEGND